MNRESRIVLYVDDDADDLELLVNAFECVAPEVQVVTVCNGLEALQYLEAAKQNTAPIPSLIVLDLNMPYLDGKQTCERIKNDQHCSNIPVMVFSSGEKPADKAWFAEQGVEYLNKPIDFAKMNTIAGYMLDVCKPL